jgi:UDP-N-acetylmuramoylalanine--D-glutamate ligase
MINFKSKKIAILGLGEENIALINYLFKKGSNITICDQKSKKQLGSYLKRIQNLSIKLKLGNNYLDDLDKFDIIFRTPGFPFLHEKIQSAIKSKVEVSSQTKLFFNLCPCRIIGVTGTKGKGTTSTLIYEILKKSKKDVYLGGNIGNPPIEFIDKLNKSSIVVLELSSFQLQDLEKSPNISVILDIKVDHLDYHINSEEYIQAKYNIIKYQTRNDYAVINADYLTSFEFGVQTKANVYWFSRKKTVDKGAFLKNGFITLKITDEQKLIDINKLILRGRHNIENISAASFTSYLAGADLISIKKTSESFKGLEHRLEFVSQVNGVKYYNDSFSTTPDTTIAAIKSFSDPIILIVGGSEKNANYSELANEIMKSKVKAIISIGETGPRIENEILKIDKNFKSKIFNQLKNIHQVMLLISKIAKKDDIVLLSPASASFDWFENYKDRGHEFKQEISRIN